MELSVIVPAFNEGQSIYQNLTFLAETLRQDTPNLSNFEIILVSDGSTDDTLYEAMKHPESNLQIHHYSKNQGKGYALKYGFYQSKGKYVAFIDSDMELHPKEIRAYLHLIRDGDFDIVIGSKRHPQSKVYYPPIRRLYSWIYQILNRVLFTLNVRDTQVGLKLFKREVLEGVLPKVLVKKYAFDLELLAVAHHLNYDKIAEAPVELSYNFDSRIDWRSIWKMLVDTAAIFYRLRILKYYDKVATVHPVKIAEEISTEKVYTKNVP